MKRIDFDDNIGAVEDKHGAGKDGWDNGTPGDVGSGTIPQDYWFDHVQEEIAGVIEGFGSTLSGGTTYTDLYNAIANNVLKTTSLANNEMEVPIYFDSDNGSSSWLGTANGDSATARILDLSNMSTISSLFRLMMQSKNTSTGNSRIYNTVTGGWIFATDCFWNNAAGEWQSETGTPQRIQIEPGGSDGGRITFYSGTLTGGTWANVYTIAGDSLPSARGDVLHFNGVQISNTYGAEGTTVTRSTDTTTVTFDSALNNSTYSVSLTPNVACTPVLSAKSGTSFDVQCYALGTGTVLDPLANPYENCGFHFTVFGAET